MIGIVHRVDLTPISAFSLLIEVKIRCGCVVVLTDTVASLNVDGHDLRDREVGAFRTAIQ